MNSPSFTTTSGGRKFSSRDLRTGGIDIRFCTAGYKGVLKGGTALFETFLNHRTVEGKAASLSMSEANRALITSEALMDHFGVFCTVAVHGKEKKPYSHTTIEKYFNAAVLYVEGYLKMKFDDDWQKKTVVKIARRILKVKITAGIHMAHKASQEGKQRRRYQRSCSSQMPWPTSRLDVVL